MIFDCKVVNLHQIKNKNYGLNGNDGKNERNPTKN